MTPPQPRKVAIVKRASQGIGAGTAAALCDAGYAVVATSRSIEPSGNVVTVNGDIADGAIEYASRGVRVNALALGVIKTAMHDPSLYDAMPAMHPLGRAGEIDDVVDGILYLDQATLVTGETLHIDGGQAVGH